MVKPLSRRFLDNMFELTSLLAEGCVVEGKLRSTNTLVISGQVIGDGEITGNLQIAGPGQWQGNIHCKDISIAGTVEGDIVASQKIEVLDSAVIRGSVTGGQVAVAKGAQIFGEMVVSDGSDVKMFEERREKKG